MKRLHREVEALWLDTRKPSQRTGAEGVKFADECWAQGLRLAASPFVHYELVMAAIRWTLTN